MRTPNEGIRRQGRTASLRRIVAAALLAGAAGVSACARDAVGPGRAVADGPSFTLNPACDSALGGETHTDSVVAAETWTRANNPHRVDGAIPIHGAGVLTLEPGTVLCFAEGAGLVADQGGRVVADGRDTARIVLTAADPAAGWWSVYLAGTPSSASVFKHVRMEYAVGALGTYDDHAAVIDSSVFRQNGAALYLWGRGTSIHRSRVDTTTASTLPAAEIGTQVTWEQNVIRGAAGVGLSVAGVHGIHLLGGRIEGSGGVGLRVTTTGPGFVSTQPVRVVGGAGYPAQMVVSAFPRIYPALANQDSLLGNARDTLVVTGGILQAFAYPIQALPWRVTGDITVQYYGILRAGPGASLAFDSAAGITAGNGGRVVARGTAAAPVLFTSTTSAGWDGLELLGSPTLSSYLTNARIENAKESYGVMALDAHTVIIDSTVFRQNGSAAFLRGPNSRISRSRIDTTLVWRAAVALEAGGSVFESTLIRGSAGAGLEVGVYHNTHVLSCEIRDSGYHGIRVWADIDVHNCNLVNNLGEGISNETGYTLDLEDNWWGDAAGPTGPSGDGVSGPVDYTPWRTTPYVLPYVP